MNFEAIFHFFNGSGIITYIVLLWLSLYFILAFSILFARLTYLATWRN
ncbi:MotA/TolQ/ExbB proton channel family protein, partial [Campylobacter sp. CH185]